MAKVELRSSIDVLTKELEQLYKQLDQLNNEYNLLHEDIVKLRQQQQGHRTAKETLTNSKVSGPAKRVLDNSIAQAQILIEEKTTALEDVEKKRVAKNSQVIALKKSLLDLQRS